MGHEVIMVEFYDYKDGETRRTIDASDMSPASLQALKRTTSRGTRKSDTRTEEELMTAIESVIDEKTQIAMRVGTMHSFWDLIFDYRALKCGGKTTLSDWSKRNQLRLIAESFEV